MTISGSYATTSTMPRGGKEKTSTGTLKVLVVFVRFDDDRTNTPTWTDYNLLPAWAQTFVDPSIPSNGIFTPLNLSDFFDRASGGNGSGVMGKFHVIGDVKYVKTKYGRSSYGSDNSVVTEVLRTLDDPAGGYNVNFKQYDNWQFMQGGQYYTHLYNPGVGDNNVDHIFFVFRGPSYDIPRAGGYKGLGGISNFTTNDGTTVTNNSGNMVFNAENYSTPIIVANPAHEYCHFLFGGDQTTGHFDGRSYDNFSNVGRVNSFSLMCAINAGWMSGYERYRLGWLNPTIVTTANSSLVLNDTHRNNEAVIVPLSYDASTGWLKEYYFIENYVTRNEYANANPFLISERYGNEFTFTHGLLVFHVKNEDFNIATNSNLSIVSADGRWSWKLAAGASTPSSRSDDLIARDFPTFHSGYSERDNITLNVGGTVYNDYVCLEHNRIADPDGWRYNENAFLGDTEDFFKEGYADVFDMYSNPAAYKADDVTPSNVGFQIVSFNPTTKAYTLNIQPTLSGVNTLRPAKPENLKVSFTGYYENATLSWQSHYASGEPYTGYNIYRRIIDPVQPDDYRVVATVGQGVTSYTDTHVLRGGPFGADYKVTTLNGAHESLPSNTVSVSGIDYMPKKVADITEIKITSNKLLQNYPNPFNPTTNIYYTVKENSMVKLQVFDILGNKVTELVNEVKPVGEYIAKFDGSCLPSGMYIYKLQCGNYSETRKMLLTK